eukprot:Selendium_serpulae@DN9405_c0_g1_i1.p1
MCGANARVFADTTAAVLFLTAACLAQPVCSDSSSPRLHWGSGTGFTPNLFPQQRRLSWSRDGSHLRGAVDSVRTSSHFSRKSSDARLSRMFFYGQEPFHRYTFDTTHPKHPDYAPLDEDWSHASVHYDEPNMSEASDSLQCLVDALARSRDSNVSSVIVDSYIDGHPRCNVMLPLLKIALRKRPGVRVMRIDVQKHPLFAQQMQVWSWFADCQTALSD